MLNTDSCTGGSTAKNWSAVAAVAAGTFSVVTSEMLPVGLLTSIGGELHASDGTAGLAVTVPGVVAAVSAPLTTVLSGRLDRRWLLVSLPALLAVANLLSAVAPSIAVLVALRVLVGVAIGGVWAIAAGLAVRLVPKVSVGRATSLIFSGIALASVLGVPAGTLIGQLFGWRAAFAAAGTATLLVTGALALLLPPLPVDRAVRFTDVPALLRGRRLRLGLVVVLLLVTGHFAAYTYVQPALERLWGVGHGLVSPLLLGYGVAGVVGNFVGGAGSARNPRGVLVVICTVLGAVVLTMSFGGVRTGVAVVLLAVWGLAYGGVSVSTQSWLMVTAPHAKEAVSALFVTVFNTAMSLGALAGGRAVDVFSLAGAMRLGGLLVLAALVAVVLTGSLRPDSTSVAGESAMVEDRVPDDRIGGLARCAERE
ncbi:MULTISPECIES: MFS transporter [Streptomycetaceae]|nr:MULTISPECIES: MFS transporter [Streptomycetaceae]MYS57194.1 MFS transporter [Streptomyces sp. SID5468]